MAHHTTPRARGANISPLSHLHDGADIDAVLEDAPSGGCQLGCLVGHNDLGAGAIRLVVVGVKPISAHRQGDKLERGGGAGEGGWSAVWGGRLGQAAGPAHVRKKVTSTAARAARRMQHAAAP